MVNKIYYLVILLLVLYLISIKAVIAQGTILPTDVLPLNFNQTSASQFENFKIRALQKLPSKFYFNSVIESSFRLETNPWQYPIKRQLIKQFPTGSSYAALSPAQKASIQKTIGLSDSTDNVFRIYPNLTAGWALTPHTRIFGNYFMISDTLFRPRNQGLDSVIQSVGGGIQQDIPIGRRGNLMGQFMLRELYETRAPAVFDYLPGITYTHMFTPNVIGYMSTILQMRGRYFFQAPTAEMDPYYTFGALWKRNSYIFLFNSTFVTNFRNQFASKLYPLNSYLWVLDFEIDKQLFRQVPGLYSFVRAEPVYNFHSGGNLGFSGIDFRLFYGLRYVFGKPPLNSTVNLIREQIKEQEMLKKHSSPKDKSKQNSQQPQASTENNQPQAQIIKLKPYELAANESQPMHGYLDHN